MLICALNTLRFERVGGPKAAQRPRPERATPVRGKELKIPKP